MVITMPTTRAPRRVSPNSAACFTVLIVSLPAFAMAITCARLDCARTRKVAKSVVPGKGWRTAPTTRPPARRTKSSVCA